MDWIEDIFSGPFYALGRYVWNSIMAWTQNLIIKTPMEYAPGAWAFVEDTLYPWSIGIGLLMVNLFFFIGLFRQNSNLKQNFTLEIFIEAAIKYVLTNGFFISGIYLIKSVLELCAAMITELNTFGSPSFRVTEQEIDAGMVLFLWLFGLIYFIVSVVCSLMIFMAVYGRFLQLYLLVVAAPFAASTMVGGSGLSHTAAAWLKTFLSKVFELVVITLVLLIAAKMSSSIAFGDVDEGLVDWIDGFGLALQNIILMVILTASVKGADSFMKRAFGL